TGGKAQPDQIRASMGIGAGDSSGADRQLGEGTGDAGQGDAATPADDSGTSHPAPGAAEGDQGRGSGSSGQTLARDTREWRQRAGTTERNRCRRSPWVGDEMNSKHKVLLAGISASQLLASTACSPDSHTGAPEGSGPLGSQSFTGAHSANLDDPSVLASVSQNIFIGRVVEELGETDAGGLTETVYLAEVEEN